MLRTFSKVYGLAGLRVGYALASPEMADALDRVRPIFNVNQPAQDGGGGVAGRARGDRGARGPHARARERLLETLAGARAAARWPRRPTSSTPTCPGGDGDGLAERLLREGFIVRALGGFGAPGAIRVTCGTDEENAAFAEALARVVRSE